MSVNEQEEQGVNGFWMRADDYSERTSFYYFKKKIWAGRDNSLLIHICADTRYQLYINGHLCCEGPCQGSEFLRYYDTANCSDKLQQGENDVLVKVMHVCEDQFISTYKKNYAALWLSAQFTCDGESRDFGSDESWTCFRDDQITFRQGEGVHKSMPEFETVAGEARLTNVPIHIWYEPQLEKGCRNCWGTSEPYLLAPRPIPQMQTYPERPFQRLTSCEFDAGKYTTAKVRFSLRAPAGTRIKIIYAECRMTPAADGSWHKEMCDAPGGYIDGVYDEVEANGLLQVFEPFWYRAFRFIRVSAEASVEVLHAGYAEYFYPMHNIAKFACSDPSINRMWEVSIQTVRCCMHEIYVDCPYYEQQQYVLDSTLEALFTYRLTDDTRMQKKCLTDLSCAQLPDGMMRANYPSTEAQVIPGFSLFFIFMVSDYLYYTGDLAFVRSMTGTIDRILAGFRMREDARGLFGATPYWPFIDWAPAWELGVPKGGYTEPLAVLNFMYAAALKKAADINRRCGRPGTASDYEAHAEEINRLVTLHCYDAKKGLFRDTPTEPAYAEHTTLWAILSGAVEGESARMLMQRTLQSDVVRCSFSMNHYFFRALEKAGLYEIAGEVLNGWRKMLDMNCTTWRENPDQPRSECHGWSSAPIYEASAMLLGVTPVTPGYEEVSVQPHTEGLDWARGEVPTPHGTILVSWEKVNGAIKLDVKLPEGVKLVAPQIER